MDSIDPGALFPQLAELPLPPKRLFLRGTIPPKRKLVAVVGSRHCTGYGIHACRTLIAGLAGHPVAVVSGLAIGIDTAAHEAAIDAGIPTIAFPGSGLSALYPACNRELAERIVARGGALMSEFAPDAPARPWMFPYRNRLMAGIADFVLVVEAAERSGSLITARLGTEYNKTVGAVPGPIDSPQSRGTNSLLRLGAVPITTPSDLLQELGLIS